MDALIQAMSIDDLERLKTQYATNQSTQTIIDGYIEVKRKAEAEAKAMALRDKTFLTATNKVLGELPEYTPDWRKNPATNQVRVNTVEVDDTDAPQEEVVANGVKELRYPKKLIRKVEIGVPVTTLTKAPKGNGETSKRAITLERRNGNMLELVGHFPSASQACAYLKLPTGGDSATRVLAREGYLISPYAGTDYTG